MRTYTPTNRPSPHKASVPNSNPCAINGQTKLVSIKEASRILKEEKSVSYCAPYLTKLCREHTLAEGIFWVKPSRSYLLNLEAFNWAIAHGRLIR